MKPSVVQHLLSPVKKEPFSLIIFKQKPLKFIDGKTRNEVIEGLLVTKSKEWYPIIKGIPRILLGSLKKDLENYYPKFFQHHHEQLTTYGYTYAPIKGKEKATISKFGYQWLHFTDTFVDNWKTWMSSAVKKSYFRNKLGLEVGCGPGGHTKKALALGTTLISVDLSHAVDTAYKINKRNPRSHILQADLYHLPFKKRYFDYVFCIGVIQHLPHPPQGFSVLTKYPKKGGGVFTNIYSNTRKTQLFIEDAIRFFIKPLPNSAILFFSYIFNFFDHLIFLWPYRFCNMIGLGKAFLSIVPSRTKIYAELGFRKSLNDWFDRLSAPIIIRYSRADVLRWHRRAQLKNISVEDFNNTNWVAYGTI